MSKIKVIFIFLAFLLSILLLQVGIKNVSKNKPSPSPESQALSFIGWKEYKNPEFNYMIKYPHDWNILKEGLFSNVPQEKLDKPHVTFEIFVDQKNNYTLETYPELVEYISQGHVARELTIDNISAIFIDRLDPEGDLDKIYILKDDYIYRISWDGTHPDVKGQFKKIMLQMIVSFKFIDQLGI